VGGGIVSEGSEPSPLKHEEKRREEWEKDPAFSEGGVTRTQPREKQATGAFLWQTKGKVHKLGGEKRSRNGAWGIAWG